MRGDDDYDYLQDEPQSCLDCECWGESMEQRCAAGDHDPFFQPENKYKKHNKIKLSEMKSNLFLCK